MSTTTLPFHPLADFPPMEDDEFAALVADIKANGLLEPIVLYQDKILDGCHRHKACLKTGVEPRFEEFKGDDAAATAFVISKNVHRRHLTAEQKRELVAKLLKAKPEASNNAIAKQAKVDDKTVAKVRGEMEARSEIPNVEKRTDTKGRKQRAKKKARVTKPVAKPVAKPTMAATTTAAKGRKQQARNGWSPERWRRHKEKKKGKPKISEARSSAPEREAAARAQQDVGPQSTGEVERLRARVDELQAEKRQLEIRVVGLESENAELKAENVELRAKLEAAGASQQRPSTNGKGKEENGAEGNDALASAGKRKAAYALDDGSDPGPIPECLRRGAS
jgi:ParB-like chromosome segregation protein Spo0J